MREMKDSGIEWIGEIPNEWDVSKIKFVADFEPTCNFENISPEDRVAYAPMECIKQGFYVAQDALYEELSHSLTPFQNGDIVMAKVTPCFENGNIAIMNKLPSGIGLGSSELFVFRAKNIVAKYLFYWLQNSDFIQRACSTMTGVGGLKRVSPFFCKNCEIHIPPYNEQYRIADYLDRKCSQIDAIIARQQEVIEKLKAYKLSVITEAVTKGLNPNVPMKDSGVEWIGEIPEHWSIVPLTKQLESIVDYRGKTPEKVDDGIFLVTARNIKNGMIDYSISSEYVKAEDYNEIMRRGIPQIGDVLFTTEAPLGQVANVDRTDIALAQRIIKFSAKKHLNSYFLKYWIMSVGFQNFLMTLSTGSTAVGIKASKLFMLPVLLAPMQEQQQIVTYLDKKCERIQSIIDSKQALIEKFTDYKKSLIYEVVTGKKEV